MKLSIASVLAFAAGLAAAVPQPGPIQFRSRFTAITYRGTTPSFSGPLATSPAGVVGFNWPNVTPFVTTMTFDPSTQPLPVGPITKLTPAPEAPGFLVPSDAAQGLYEFRFGELPPESGVLSNEFAIRTLECGGNCGGLQLVYGQGGEWLAYEDAQQPGAWTVRWWNGEGTRPSGGRGVWLVREGA